MPAAKAYIVALALGVLVGPVYRMLAGQSPVPWAVALVGLLGEQIVPRANELVQPKPPKLSEIGNACVHHLFGALRGVGLGATTDAPGLPPPEQPT